uniref:adhesion G protein-coupled receptor L4-like isoform X2 n=1 Tax=Styela clava TaxID=7725 RepID=UPI00193A07B7|nr:adhesion G protein-coupled receptor L4-like isoform X2 [Styela clava]
MKIGIFILFVTFGNIHAWQPCSPKQCFEKTGFCAKNATTKSNYCNVDVEWKTSCRFNDCGYVFDFSVSQNSSNSDLFSGSITALKELQLVVDNSAKPSLPSGTICWSYMVFPTTFKHVYFKLTESSAGNSVSNDIEMEFDTTGNGADKYALSVPCERKNESYPTLEEKDVILYVIEPSQSTGKKTKKYRLQWRAAVNERNLGKNWTHLEIFREASIDPSDFTTPQATTQVDTTTDTVTQAVTTMMLSTTTSRVNITTPPLYLESPIPSLEDVSEELYRTQIENEQKDFTDQETLEESSEKVIQISSELAEKIEEDDVKMESEIAASYISAVSETTNTLVATKNAETWKEVPENTKKLNEIIENADSATEVIVRSFTPANVTSIQVIQTLSMSIIVVPSKTETPVSVSPTQNVEVGLSESTVTSLSQNTPVVVAATVHSGASDCYNDIPPTDVDIIDQEDPVENPEFGLRPTFDSTKPLQIITEIVSVNIKPKLKTGELITLSFVHIMNISLENEFNLFCAYINKTTAKWTNHDCKIIETNNTHTTFVSPHLTNFAILMQVVDFEIPENHLKNLSLITYIGCSISIFCLVLSLCVFALVKNAFEESGNIRGHRTERYHLHANLALSMLLGQVTFLVGADNPPGTDSCKATAILLHFFYMSAFSWMLVEGLHLYNLVVKVFRSAQSRLGYYYMIGWGTPLLICTISVAAAFSGYGENKNCWLDINNTRVIWAFAGPALFVILVNTIILIKVTRVITTLAKSKDNCLSCMTDKATVVVCAKGIAVLMPILGVTWVFGVFAVNEDTIIFQYLFAIFNSLQGFFLFMFHCIFNSETRASLKYRTKSFRSDLQSRSASHSRSRRQTKVELVRNAEQVNPAKGGEGNSNSFRNPAHTQVTPLGSPTSHRQASTSSNNTSTRSAKRNGFKQFNNTERGNVGSRPASGNSDNFPSRRVTKAW